jgi:type III secretion protein SpaR/YscT/HrcT
MTENYWMLYINSALASQEPTAALTLFFLFMGRMLPIIAQSPFFGARVLPHPVKIAFVISLFAIFVPHLLVVTKEPLEFNTLAILLFAKEMFVGYLLGLLVSIPLTVVQTAGMLVDHQRGGASLMVNDPTIQNQSSPLGTLFNMVLIYIFFIIDGPFLFIDAIIKSYEIVPPDQFINPFFFDKTSAFWEMSLTLLNKVMVVSLQLASPALIAILMTDVFLGIANRLATQVQITFLGLPLKSLLALLVLFIGWRILTKQMAVESFAWLNSIQEVLLMFKPGTGTEPAPAS